MQEIDELNEIQKKYPEEVTVISIAIQNTEAVSKWLSVLSSKGAAVPTYPIFIDPDKQTYMALLGTSDPANWCQ